MALISRISNRLHDVLVQGYLCRDSYIDVENLCESCELGRDFQHMIAINRVEDQKCERYEVPTFCVKTIKRIIESGSNKGEDRFILPIASNLKRLVTYRAQKNIEKTFLKAVAKMWTYNSSLSLLPAAIPNPDGSEPILFYGTAGIICDQDMNPLLLCTTELFRKKISGIEQIIYDTSVHAGTSHCYIHPCIIKEDNILYKGLRTKFIPNFCDHTNTDIIIGNHPMLHCVKCCSTPGSVTFDIQESLIYECLNTYLDEILNQFPEYDESPEYDNPYEVIV